MQHQFLESRDRLLADDGVDLRALLRIVRRQRHRPRAPLRPAHAAIDVGLGFENALGLIEGLDARQLVVGEIELHHRVLHLRIAGRLHGDLLLQRDRLRRIGAKLDPHQHPRLPVRQVDALRVRRQRHLRAFQAQREGAGRMFRKIALVDIGGDLAPAVQHLARCNSGPLIFGSVTSVQLVSSTAIQASL